MIRKSPEYLDFLVDNDGMKRKLRSALDAVKEGWNSELPFHVTSFWLLGFHGLWWLARKEHYIFVKDAKIMTKKVFSLGDFES